MKNVKIRKEIEMKLFKTKKQTKTEQEFAAEILEIFEEKLEELNVTLPNSDREGKEDEARIFGSDYYDLEDKVAELLRNNKKQLVENT